MRIIRSTCAFAVSLGVLCMLLPTPSRSASNAPIKVALLAATSGTVAVFVIWIAISSDH